MLAHSMLAGCTLRGRRGPCRQRRQSESKRSHLLYDSSRIGSQMKSRYLARATPELAPPGLANVAELKADAQGRAKTQMARLAQPAAC